MYFFRLKLSLELLYALGADSLSAEIDNVVCVVAERACGLIFLKDDLVIVGEYLDGVLYVDTQNGAELLGKNYSSKLVNLSYYSGRFHFFDSFLLLFNVGGTSHRVFIINQ